MKLLDFNAHFRTEEDCEQYLKAYREQNGLSCTECGSEKLYWDKYNKKWVCTKCGRESPSPQVQ